ncbi:MAG: hypothetical protein ACN6ON_12055 [Sphingobacterium sp.]
MLCALSYHDDTNADGSLSFGFPFEIYHKVIRVMFIDTQEIGESSSLYLGNLIANIIFAFVISLLLFPIKEWLKKRKTKRI